MRASRAASSRCSTSSAGSLGPSPSASEELQYMAWVATGPQRETFEVSEVQKNFMFCLASRCSKLAVREANEVISRRHSAACFQSQSIPPMPLEQYIRTLWDISLHYGMNDIDNSWKATYILVNRFAERFPKFFTPLTVHRVLLTCYAVGMKLTTDRNLSNTVVAKYGGVTSNNLRDMELVFLTLLDFEVNVSRQDYICALKEIAEECGSTTTSLPPQLTGLPATMLVCPRSKSLPVAASPPMTVTSPHTAYRRLSHALHFSHTA
ncbi:hypothetical protein DIPPA_09043 [Diplonema papillatum]|nr:hypothetical protein DIPPA_09043 [Diplonema papillatum]